VSLQAQLRHKESPRISDSALCLENILVFVLVTGRITRVKSKQEKNDLNREMQREQSPLQVTWALRLALISVSVAF